MTARTPLLSRKVAGLATIAALVAAWIGPAPALAADPAAFDFAHDVLPILKARCAGCHTDGTYKGAFSLDTRESALKSEAIVAGSSKESELIERVRSADPEFRMPPKGPRLKAEEVARLETWIDRGLTWESGFSFKKQKDGLPLKLRRPWLPPPHAGRDHPIDRIIDAYQATNRVPTPAPIDDATFLRRVTLDLNGLLPAPDALDTFAKDASPDRKGRLIRRLLDDRRAYAEHWLTFWNDLLRNDYKGTGYIDGGRKQISGWLYRALLENTPYDRFVHELISPTAESEGFINGIKWRGRVNASQVREIQFSQNVSQVFFGINMKCASCHDSFIDRWTLDDAYGLAAIVADAPLEVARCDKLTGKVARPRFLWPELGTIEADLPKSDRLERLAKLITQPDNGRFARTIVNRVWQRLMGRGIVHPVDVMANPPWSADLLDELAGFLIDHRYDLKALVEQIAGSHAYQSRSIAVSEEGGTGAYVFRGPEIKRMTAEEFLDAVWAITGAGPTRPDAPVRPVEASEPGPTATPTVRASLRNSDPLMRSLGRPNREQVVTTRGDVLTTLQALDLSNGDLFAETLSRGAPRMLKVDPASSPEERVRSLYRRALGREPNAVERATALELIGTPATVDGLADLLWAIFMLPEFQLIR